MASGPVSFLSRNLISDTSPEQRAASLTPLLVHPPAESLEGEKTAQLMTNRGVKHKSYDNLDLIRAISRLVIPVQLAGWSMFCLFTIPDQSLGS
ncbi:hypothetical protein TrVFT333_002666 [Trichoderma virens FT-333]|nr:hypothetical protein TrVFT333_002666 [Trichoderma virens FT-333]